MGKVRELSERLWRGEETTHGLQPVSLMLGVEPYQDGLAFLSSFGNVTLLDTRDGLVLLDTGGFFLAGQNHALAREWTQSPLSLAVYTHGHVDHASASRRTMRKPGPPEGSCRASLPTRKW